MSVPREVALRTVDGRPQLVQQPVASLDTLETGQRHTESSTTITGERTLDQARRRARHPRHPAARAAPPAWA